MPRRKLIRPAEPLTPPEPGSLEETIYLGDCASAYAKPLAQLRWYDRRGELLIAIQNRDKNAERVKELEAENKRLRDQVAQPPVPVPPVPAPVVDPETERRVNKMLQQLEDLGEQTPVPVPVSSEELNKKLAEAERDRKTKEAAKRAEEKSAEDLEKKAANDKKAARIVELKTLRESIYKNMNTPGFNVMLASNPTFGRAPLEGLKSIEAELRQLEDTPVSKVPDQFTAIVEEQREDNRRTQKEYQAEYNFQRSGMQISPSKLGLFRDGE